MYIFSNISSKVATAFLIFAALSISSCGGGGSVATSSAMQSSSSSLITLTLPSPNEVTFAEKRDFYISGSFKPGVKVTGNIKIELYKLPNTLVPVRSIQSHVDSSGTTPLSAIRQNNPEGYIAKGYKERQKPLLVPDLIQEPGGFLNPNNKVLVTPTGFVAIILGGVTKDFDTSYTDNYGKPLQDLTAGTYKLVVKGLSGDIAGSITTMQLKFSKNRTQLGRFIQGEPFERLKSYANENNLHIYLDPLAGYFTDDNYLTSFSIPARWSAQNSIEIVNNLPGIIDNDIYNSENHVLIYAIADYNATHSLEIGAIVANGLVEAAKTFWLHYDIGEPSIKYTQADSNTKTLLNGNIVPFKPGAVCELTRVETKNLLSSSQNNIWHSVDYDLKTVIPFSNSTPILLSSTNSLDVYGNCRPISAAATPGKDMYKYFYTVHNRVQTIHYTITGPLGNIVDDETLPIALQRFYDDSTTAVNSIYEFKHDFHFNAGSGSYQINWTGLDVFGSVVPGAGSTFNVTVQ